MCRICLTTDLNNGLAWRSSGGWAPRHAYKLPCGEVVLSRHPIPGARKVNDSLGREHHVDSGNVMWAEIERREKEREKREKEMEREKRRKEKEMEREKRQKEKAKDWGSSDRELRPRGEGGKVVKEKVAEGGRVIKVEGGK